MGGAFAASVILLVQP